MSDLTNPSHAFTEGDRYHIGAVIVSMLDDDDADVRGVAMAALVAVDRHERHEDKIVLTQAQAEALAARSSYYVDNGDDEDADEVSALVAIGEQTTGLR